MFRKINPMGILHAHFTSLRDNSIDKVSIVEVVCHILIPAIFATAHFAFFSAITEGLVSIIVSAASIVAGLMLNLMVLIYTLAYNSKNTSKPMSNAAEFQTISSETLSSISYTVLVCIFLVISSFFALVEYAALACLGRFLTVYFGVAAILSLLLVLKRCYGIVQFELKQ